MSVRNKSANRHSLEFRLSASFRKNAQSQRLDLDIQNQSKLFTVREFIDAPDRSQSESLARGEYRR
jgi:hypothetical protein